MTAWTRARLDSTLTDDRWRVAYVHIPKTGGTSIGRALARAGVAACVVMTSSTGLQGCGSTFTSRLMRMQQTRVIIAERPYVDVQRYVQPTGHNKWLFVAVVREPRSWFYSAVAQWCLGTGVGRRSLRCQEGTTVHDLLRAGWFKPLQPRRLHRPRNDSDPSRDGYLPYFALANEQSNHLGAIWHEPNFLICSIERISSIASALGEVLEGNQHLLARRHDHQLTVRWSRSAAYQRSVEWDELRRYYLLDAGLHSYVNRSGCVAHSVDPVLRQRLETAIAPVKWL